MSTLTKNSLTLRIRRVTFQADLMRVHLEDGQVLVVPVRLYPRLQFATMPERRNHRLIAGGKGINWPELDEDISLQGLLARQPSSESAKSVLKWLQARQLKRSPTPTLFADIQLLAPPK
jgi:hypothetical protein